MAYRSGLGEAKESMQEDARIGLMARRQKMIEDQYSQERNDFMKAKKDAEWSSTYNKNRGLNPDGSEKPKPLPVSGESAPVYKGGGLGIDGGYVGEPVAKQAPIEKPEDPFETEMKRQKMEIQKRQLDEIDGDMKKRLEKEESKKETARLMFASVYNWTKNAKTPEEKKVAVDKLNEFGKSLGMGQLQDVSIDENGQFILTEAGPNGQAGMVHTIPRSKFEEEYTSFYDPEARSRRDEASLKTRALDIKEGRLDSGSNMDYGTKVQIDILKNAIMEAYKAKANAIDDTERASHDTSINEYKKELNALIGGATKPVDIGEKTTGVKYGTIEKTEKGSSVARVDKHTQKMIRVKGPSGEIAELPEDKANKFLSLDGYSIASDNVTPTVRTQTTKDKDRATDTRPDNRKTWGASYNSTPLIKQQVGVNRTLRNNTVTSASSRLIGDKGTDATLTKDDIDAIARIRDEAMRNPIDPFTKLPIDPQEYIKIKTQEYFAGKSKNDSEQFNSLFAEYLNR